ncbi:hypothetical protein QBC34DRAFT_428723 [Podospora aff. communis PSN243]|uniref:AA1-like domain-containing protein n=1 Tax=Podospora aff. communis PSN243 TaxID=3040156 RepID=A0AAV9GBC1_9PEZI|nr:hypothetical protein QBC34DRAFT_428723 [Podospora aff. communis PSN243]
MKLAPLLSLGAQALLFSGATASPIDFDPVSSSEIISRDSDLSSTKSLESRCTWNDDHGPISCGYFSVVISYYWYNGITRHAFDIKGENFKVVRELDCTQAHLYQNFHSPLPFAVQVHPGNVCHYNPTFENFNNLLTIYREQWIRYSNQHLNVLTDTRCGPVTLNRVNGASARRCIIAQRP